MYTITYKGNTYQYRLGQWYACGQLIADKAIVQALNRKYRAKERDELMRSLGLTKVRGAVSGRTYWE